MVHSYMVYTELAETAAVSSGTSRVATKQLLSIPLGWIFKTRYKKSYSHSFRITCEKSAASLLDSGE